MAADCAFAGGKGKAAAAGWSPRWSASRWMRVP